ncbi:hypothetical protein GCM10022243_57990 [Saccharothrix violaceirubra]|uniref:Uncharacterized protein n=1 Tax=Saccharothrix violaceirubra TaxID=413306 RepID=A0A7W7T394_9PSEU|nr:hypothetical protein [Saccharothrix violaceirubra]MBB4965770.1 hypothetical protein [Saccharothrix violaceirubra]
MNEPILPDPYWAGMITGRLVHLHLGLVDHQLVRDHRARERALIDSAGTSVAVVARLDGTRPADRVLARLLGCAVGGPLADGIRLLDRFVRQDSGPLVFDEPGSGLVSDGADRAYRRAAELGLEPVCQLGIGLVGLTSLPAVFEPAVDREAVLLPAATWSLPTAELTASVLEGAARSLALTWAYAEVLAYGLDGPPPGTTAAATDFARGVLAEYHRRADGRHGPDPGEPTQVPELPLLSELVRCWWPAPGRAHNIFGSPFDYMTHLEVSGARR